MTLIVDKKIEPYNFSVAVRDLSYRLLSTSQLSMAQGGGHTFGQRQPPLYVAIQKILEKYPDGQIFKVGLVRK